MAQQLCFADPSQGPIVSQQASKQLSLCQVIIIIDVRSQPKWK